MAYFIDRNGTPRCQDCKAAIIDEEMIEELIGNCGFTQEAAFDMADLNHEDSDLCQGFRNVELAYTEDGEEIEVCGTCLSSPCCCQAIVDQAAS